MHFASIKVRESLARKLELDRSLGKYGPVPPETAVEWKERMEREWVSEEGEEASAEALRECVFFVEAFYRCAFRLKELLCRLPGLEKFDPLGVRNVRNHLIDHPEKKRITTWGWAYDYRVGPRLRPGRGGDEPREPQDAGLWINLAEFEAELTKTLRRSTGKA